MAKAPQRKGAKVTKPGVRTRLQAWVFNHAQACSFSLGKLGKAPISSAMTCMVIAISLALPATFSTLLGNLRTVSSGWDVTGSVTLYLAPQVEDADGAAFARELNALEAVGGTRFIGRDEALATFRKISGFADVLDSLDENPLPAAIVIEPAAGSADARTLEALAAELSERAEVESAQVDLEWIKRLNALIDLALRVVLVVGVLLSLAVLLIVGNTIRLDIHSRREEIVVIKLIGATNAFVRRPFLYGGLFYGLFGGALGAILVIVALRFLDTPSTYLVSLYGGDVNLVDVDPIYVAILILVSSALGLVGSWISVGRHLNEIEPT